MRQSKAKPINKLAQMVHMKKPEGTLTQVRKELKSIFRRRPVADVWLMIRQHREMEKQGTAQ